MKGYNIRVSFSCLVLILLVHNSAFSKPLENPPDGYIGTHSMNYLGGVQGKHYFYEHEPLRTWPEAKQACHDANMQMVTPSSGNHVHFLNTIPYTENYTGHHFWTSARDSQYYMQFMWDTNNNTVYPPSGLAEFVVYYPIQSCLLYMSQVELGKFYLALCQDHHGTLCELDLGD